MELRSNYICTFYVEARDEPRLLSRVSNLIGRLDLSIKSFTLAPTPELGKCRMRFTLGADREASELLRRLLGRLIEVSVVEMEFGAVALTTPLALDRQNLRAPMRPLRNKRIKGECHDKLTI